MTVKRVDEKTQNHKPQSKTASQPASRVQFRGNRLYANSMAGLWSVALSLQGVDGGVEYSARSTDSVDFSGRAAFEEGNLTLTDVPDLGTVRIWWEGGVYIVAPSQGLLPRVYVSGDALPEFLNRFSIDGNAVS